MSKNIKNIFLAFIIGSSWMTFVLLFYGFYGYQGKFNPNNCIENILNIEPYYFYTLFAPLYIGLMSALAIILHLYYHIPIRQSYFMIGIISAICISITITYCDVYQFTRERLFQQYLRLQIYHYLIYSIVIANIYIFLHH